MTYPESSSKKLARLAFWSSAIERLGREPEKCLCAGLAGWTGGDLQTLQGLEVPAESVALFDTSPLAARSAQAAVPGLSVIQRPIEKGIGGIPTRDVILLDFGAHVDKNTLRVLRETATHANMSEGRIFGVSFLVGRELHATWLDQATESFVRGTRAMKEDVYAHWSRAIPPMIRAFYITQQAHAIRQRSLHLNLVQMWYYEAREDYGMGSHVVTLQFEWKKRASKTPLAQVHTAVQHPNVCIPSASMAKRYVGKNAIWLLQEGANPELLLNISAGSARSYRGRSTAGAYV